MVGDQHLTARDVWARLQRYDIRKNQRLAASFPSNQYPHVRRCATLVPLFFSSPAHELHVLLTERAATLRTHASLVAFPGGARDPSDVDDAHTALREAHEEIGLRPSDVTVLAHLPPSFVSPVSAVYHVTAFIPSNFRPAPSPQEVARVFSVPLRFFLQARPRFLTFRVAGVQLRSPEVVYRVQPDWQARIWGMTCSVCIAVARAVFEAKPAPLLSLGARTAECESRQEKEHDGQENVFQELEAAFHALCLATRPAASL